ncbi:hypothetical protein [Paenibacillus tyrfis]|uniref:hypothetical protein n=1 Tax=Paenibacillus tyrfis TaxID=1501230 RepID=UPI00209DA372|nr:hypothetical protein [Paenibacillus tyrfis]MCP1306808.1 hypothetical protein [Paenibacillus tyrfis]
MAAVLLAFLFFIYKKNFKEREQFHRNMLSLALVESEMIFWSKFNWNILKISTFISYLKIKKSISFILYILITYVFIFAALIVFVSHTAYQWGGFGKNLAQFDTDFVVVDYNLNGEIKTVQGIRVYHDKNYIVVRDKQNNMHNIFTDQIHIQTKQLQTN